MKDFFVPCMIAIAIMAAMVFFSVYDIFPNPSYEVMEKIKNQEQFYRRNVMANLEWSELVKINGAIWGTPFLNGYTDAVFAKDANGKRYTVALHYYDYGKKWDLLVVVEDGSRQIKMLERDVNSSLFWRKRWEGHQVSWFKGCDMSDSLNMEYASEELQDKTDSFYLETIAVVNEILDKEIAQINKNEEEREQREEEELKIKVEQGNQEMLECLSSL